MSDLPDPSTTADPWPRIAGLALSWLASRAIVPRDAIVLLPFAELLAPARRAFAAVGGWQPRIETPNTLATALWPPGAAAGDDGVELAVEPDADRLEAALLLRNLRWGAQLAERDAQGFAHAVRALADTAALLARGAAARPPSRRGRFWAQARELLPPQQGPGASERLLARVALEWAAAAAPPRSDALYALAPSAWIAVRGGGPDPFVDALLAAAQADGRAVLMIDTDATPMSDHAAGDDRPADADPLDLHAETGGPARDRIDAAAGPAPTPPRRVVAVDFEAEAQLAALEVIAQRDAGHVPVLLVAQDRLLVRRVRALLERADLRLHDETGWKLSTTRAAARLAALLDAAAPHAGADDWLNWLKEEQGEATGDDDAGAAARAAALLRLEAHWRREPRRQRGGTPSAPPDDAQAQALLAAAQRRIEPLAGPARPLSKWLSQLAIAWPEAVDGHVAAWPAADRDPAAQQLRAVLRLDAHDDGTAFGAAAARTRLSYAEFVRWIDDRLEDADFMPPFAADAGAAEVVITPLARALLRPFAAAVLPGCDARRLGAAAPPQPLLAPGLLDALGLPGVEARRLRERRAFAHLLRLPRVVLLRRAADADEALAESSLVELAAWRAAKAGTPWPTPQLIAVPSRQIATQPSTAPLPSAPQRLPAQLSATMVEALRACPYRFFVHALLGLHEVQELEQDADPRDAGQWLHAALQRFHGERAAAPADAASDLAHLREVAGRLRDEEGFDAAAMLPFAAAFDEFAPRYVHWLRQRDAAGLRFEVAERALRINPPQLAGIQLHGRLDRIDRDRDGAVELIDYKTTSIAALRRRVGEPLEDTQLAFYALLAGALVAAPAGVATAGGAPAVRAGYLALLDRADARKPFFVGHDDVQRSAAALLDGLARELAALRDGAALPALGELPTCDWCDARGLCRRDDWKGSA